MISKHTNSYLVAFDIDEWLSDSKLATAEKVLSVLSKRSLTQASKKEEGSNISIHLKIVSSRGYLLQKDFANKLNTLFKSISLNLEPEDIILCYTPLKAVLANLQNDILLIAGSEDVENVFPSLGITRYITTNEYALMVPEIFTANYRFPEKSEVEAMREKISKRLNIPANDLAKGVQVGATFIWGNHCNWEESLGIIMDHLASEDGKIPNKLPEIGPSNHIPVYILNDDFIDMEDPALERLGCGALNVSIYPVYKKMFARDFDPLEFHKGSKNFVKYLSEHNYEKTFYFTSNEIIHDFKNLSVVDSKKAFTNEIQSNIEEFFFQ